MSTIPSFTLTPQIDIQQISTANANRDGTGTVATLATGAASPNFLKVKQIIVKAQATTTTGMIRFFLHDGTSFRLLHEMTVTAFTPSATVAAFEDTWVCPDDLILPSASWSIRVSTEKAETFNVHALSAKF